MQVFPQDTKQLHAVNSVESPIVTWSQLLDCDNTGTSYLLNAERGHLPQPQFILTLSARTLPVSFIVAPIPMVMSFTVGCSGGGTHWWAFWLGLLRGGLDPEHALPCVFFALQSGLGLREYSRC